MSQWTMVRTGPMPSDLNGRDKLAGVQQWDYTATSVTAKFLYKASEGYFYVLWCKWPGFQADVHRSKAAKVPPGTPDGTLLEKTVYGFEPESGWFFRLVSNPDPIAGEQ